MVKGRGKDVRIYGAISSRRSIHITDHQSASPLDGLPHSLEQLWIPHVHLPQLVQQQRELLVLLEVLLQHLHRTRRLLLVQELRVHYHRLLRPAPALPQHLSQPQALLCAEGEVVLGQRLGDCALDEVVELLDADAGGLRHLGLHAVLVDASQVLLEGDFQFLSVLLERAHEGLGLPGLEALEHIALGLVDADFAVDVLLVPDDLRRGESDDVGVLLPGLEDGHQLPHLLPEVAQLGLGRGVPLLQLLLPQRAPLPLLGHEVSELLGGEVLGVAEAVELEGVALQFLREFVALVGGDLVPEFEVEGDELLVLLADDLLVAGEEVHLVEVPELVGERLCEQLVVVLRGGDVLGEDRALLQPRVHVLRVEPVVARFVLHDLQDPAAVDPPQVLLVQVLVQPGRVVLVPRPPPRLVLVEAVGVGEDLLAEAALPLEVPVGHELVVAGQVLVLDLVLVLLGLEVHLPAGVAEGLLVLGEGGAGGGGHAGLARVVEPRESLQHS